MMKHKGELIQAAIDGIIALIYLGSGNYFLALWWLMLALLILARFLLKNHQKRLSILAMLVSHALPLVMFKFVKNNGWLIVVAVLILVFMDVLYYKLWREQQQ